MRIEKTVDRHQESRRIASVEQALGKSAGGHTAHVAYTPEIKPTVLFDDIEEKAVSVQNKSKTFSSRDPLEGNILSWHI